MALRLQLCAMHQARLRPFHRPAHRSVAVRTDLTREALMRNVRLILDACGCNVPSRTGHHRAEHSLGTVQGRDVATSEAEAPDVMTRCVTSSLHSGCNTKPASRRQRALFRCSSLAAMAPSQDLARGINADSRSKSYSRRNLHGVKKKNGGKFPQHEKQDKPAEKEYSGKFYPGEDVKKPLNRRVIRNPTKLRESITPGTVLILLAGRFKGKRVVFLKQLPSGLLLVSGPFKVNGVPARRVNQAYVIATSTKIELPAELPLDTFEDSFFRSAEKAAAKKEKSKKKGDASMFTEEEPQAKELKQEYLDAQKSLDSALMKTISAEYKGYLGTRFTLKSGDRPHLMKF
jgi:large subunit ribosomal protein L6e